MGTTTNTSTTTTTVETLIETLNSASVDAQKFESGNDSAGARLRKALQTVAVSCKELRAVVQTERNARRGTTTTKTTNNPW